MAYLKLLFIRHAQSIGNIQGQMEGQGSTALSERGWQQAHCLSQHMVAAASRRPTHLYSSPLLRASQTADVLTAALKQVQHPFHTRQTAALQEMHQGIFQGLTWMEAQAQYPELCTQLLSSLRWQPVPQAETLVAARSRSHQWIHHILSVHSPGEVIWMVSHEGILQQMIAVVMGCDRTWKVSMANTAIFEFWLAAPPKVDSHTVATAPFTGDLPIPDRFNPEYSQLRCFNDTSHLIGKLDV